MLTTPLLWLCQWPLSCCPHVVTDVSNSPCENWWLMNEWFQLSIVNYVWLPLLQWERRKSSVNSGNFRHENTSMFLPQFPRSSLGNFGSCHGNRWIPGTTLLLPAEPPSPPSCPHVHRRERAESFQTVWTVSIWLLEKRFAASLTLTNPLAMFFFFFLLKANFV